MRVIVWLTLYLAGAGALGQERCRRLWQSQHLVQRSMKGEEIGVDEFPQISNQVAPDAIAAPPALGRMVA